jgi:hypothetical protein
MYCIYMYTHKVTKTDIYLAFLNNELPLILEDVTLLTRECKYRLQHDIVTDLIRVLPCNGSVNSPTYTGCQQ